MEEAEEAAEVEEAVRLQVLAQPQVPVQPVLLVQAEQLARVGGLVPLVLALVRPQPLAEVEAVVVEEAAAAVLHPVHRKPVCSPEVAAHGPTTTPQPPMSACGTFSARPSISQSTKSSPAVRRPRIVSWPMRARSIWPPWKTTFPMF